MPRLSNRPPKLRRHATGQAFVTYQGKNKYLGRWNSPEAKAAYRAFCREWQPAPVVTRVPDYQRTTIAELLLAFREHAQVRYRKGERPTSTIDTFRTPCRVLREMFGGIRAKDFGPVRLREVRQAFVERGVSRPTANRYGRLLVQVFKWGVSRELVPLVTWQSLLAVEPLRPSETAARDPEPVRCVPDADVDATLPHCSPIVKAMVTVQRLTGARPGEVCAMRWADVDRSGEVWLYRPPGHKLEHLGLGRTIAIGPKAQEALADFITRPPEAFVFSPSEAEKTRRATATKARVTPLERGNVVGANRRRKPVRVPGDRYTTASYRRAVERAAELAGVPKWAPNRLRHSAASKIRQAVGIEAAQVALGHSSRATTEAHYAEPNIHAAIEAAKLIG